MKKLKYYRYPHPNNVGDILSPIIFEYFLPNIDIQQVGEGVKNKLLGVGSIMRVLQKGDVVWGAGVMRKTDKFPQARFCEFLAVRGKLSRNILLKSKAQIPEIYGDPAILLPLIYNPENKKKKYKIGIVPHFIDHHLLTKEKGNELAQSINWKLIDICLPFDIFINEILECEHIISSSLHGLIIAEVYGLSVQWVELSNNVIGNGFKFHDYLSATNRVLEKDGRFPILEKDILKKQQENLISVLLNYVSRL